MDSETYILAPSAVVEKAHRLVDQGNHREALDLLHRNCVIAEIYPAICEMKAQIPAIKKKLKRAVTFSRSRT